MTAPRPLSDPYYSVLETDPDGHRVLGPSLVRLHALADRLQHGDVSAISEAIDFLEADPWHFRSGYVKELLMLNLRRVPLTPEIRERLKLVVLDRVDGKDRRDFRSVCKLAATLVDDTLRIELKKRADSDDVRVARHATWALKAIERQDHDRGH